MSYMQEVNRRGEPTPRRTFYPQRGMEAPVLRSTGCYRGDTGNLPDLYLIRPRRNPLLNTGMTVLDLAVILAVLVSIAVTVYAIGPGMDRCIDALGW
jgi:hypothetical protein